MNGYQSIDCESYIKRIDSEHAAVRHSLINLHKMLATCHEAPDKCPCVPHAELVRLREELARHFLEEEAGGCLEEAACRCPSLSHEVSLLEAQHRELLQLLDGLVAATASQTSEVPLEKFREFEALLLEHEKKEDQVIRHGFNVA
jgi:iron-sulfur cluster repair protein YtfE (RIC family)